MVNGWPPTVSWCLFIWSFQSQESVKGTLGSVFTTGKSPFRLGIDTSSGNTLRGREWWLLFIQPLTHLPLPANEFNISKPPAKKRKQLPEKQTHKKHPKRQKRIKKPEPKDLQKGRKTSKIRKKNQVRASSMVPMSTRFRGATLDPKQP